MEKEKWDRIERLIRAGEYQARLQAIREVYSEIVQLNVLLGQLLKVIVNGDDGHAIF